MLVTGLALAAYNTFRLAEAGSWTGALLAVLSISIPLWDAAQLRHSNPQAAGRVIPLVIAAQLGFWVAADLAEDRAECRVELESSN